jgi:glycosyltransferase involved in cell wall biosynthesis
VLHDARIAVVVPAYDEERFIASTVRGVPRYVDDVIVVDDASRDGTAQALADVDDPRLSVIRHASNRGVGAAIVTGYHHARGLGADVTAVMAGDGQMHPDDLEGLVTPVLRGEADYVKGNRLAHRAVHGTMPPARMLGTAVFAWLTRHAAGLPALSDSQCGFTAISRHALDALAPDLDALWPRYGFPNDILGALARRRLRIGEVVVRPVYRGEASGLRPWHVATIGYLIGRIAWTRATEPRPALPPAPAVDPLPDIVP